NEPRVLCRGSFPYRPRAPHSRFLRADEAARVEHAPVAGRDPRYAGGRSAGYLLTDASYPNCLETRSACSLTTVPTLSRSMWETRNSGPDSQIDAMGYSR